MQRFAQVPPFPVTRPWGAVGMAGFALMAGVQIAIPLAEERDALTSLVIVGFAIASFGFAADAWGGARAAATAAFVVPATLVLERVGSTTGFPFGDYSYTGLLEPSIGDVPMIVPLAWFAMGVPALEVGRRLAPRGLATVLVASAALTAWDLFLDPQMVDEGYWTWATDGAYVGIPLSNYLGWLGSGVVVLGVVGRIAGPRLAEPSLPLLALYTWWAVMNTVGLIVFFGLPLAGVVGGLAMGSIAAAAWRRSLQPSPAVP